MFFSAYGINSRGMIVDTSEEETELRIALMKNAKTSVFLCDNSKFDKSAMFNIASLSEVDYLITNGSVPSRYPRVREKAIVIV